MLYAMRFYLHFTVDEWRKLPWWQQRLYTEGLNKHKPWDETGESRESNNIPEGHEDDVSGWANLGLTVQKM